MRVSRGAASGVKRNNEKEARACASHIFIAFFFSSVLLSSSPLLARSARLLRKWTPRSERRIEQARDNNICSGGERVVSERNYFVICPTS